MGKKQSKTAKSGRKALPEGKKKIGVSVYLESDKVKKAGGRTGAATEIIRCLDFSGSSLL